jgi:hypothetical protein
MSECTHALALRLDKYALQYIDAHALAKLQYPCESLFAFHLAIHRSLTRLDASIAQELDGSSPPSTKMPIAQIILPVCTDVSGATTNSTNQRPKATTGSRLNGRLVVSADFFLGGLFDTVELSFKGEQCTYRLVMCS